MPIVVTDKHRLSISNNSCYRIAAPATTIKTTAAIIPPFGSRPPHKSCVFMGVTHSLRTAAALVVSLSHSAQCSQSEANTVRATAACAKMAAGQADTLVVSVAHTASSAKSVQRGLSKAESSRETGRERVQKEEIKRALPAVDVFCTMLRFGLSIVWQAKQPGVVRGAGGRCRGCCRLQSGGGD